MTKTAEKKQRSILDSLLDLLETLGKLLKPNDAARAPIPARTNQKGRYKQR
ncbi:MAG: hypothetical protein KJ064_26325 [Anaerolineae bacterium]|jgi:hypothetical protein|nr:hypothetical protein [Anaerolineae bacterium]